MLTYSSVGTNAAGQTGTFQGGETLTGGTSALTATFRGTGTGGAMNIEIDDITTGATSLKIVNGSAVEVGGSATAHYFVLDETLQQVMLLKFYKQLHH